MSLGFDEINVIGNIINHTYGKSSAIENSHVAITATVQGDDGYSILCVTALEVVNILDAMHMRKEKERAEQELDQHINKYISNLKKEYKKKENAGKTQLTFSIRT